MAKKGHGKWISQYKEGQLTERLKDLYWNRGLSLERIAEIENVRVSTVHKRMKLLGIALRKQHDWHHVHVNITPSEELAYIIGVLLGDGAVCGKQIRLRTVDIKFAESFYKALKQVGFRPSLTIEENHGFGHKPLYVTTAASVDFVKWFKNLSINDIEAIVLKTRNLAVSFLRGFYESEGCLRVEKQGNPRAMLYNTNRQIVNLVVKAINFIGFNAYVQGPYNVYIQEPNGTRRKCKPVFYIQIPRPDSVSFISKLSPCIKGVM
jgi:intein-encoded DNA endonuclease-like protein